MIITKMPNILKKKIKGFTLVEVLVSVAIIGILVSLSVIASTNVRLKTRDTKRLSDISSIVNALQAYYDSTKTYPTMIFPGQPIASNGITFLKAVPSNPMPRTDGGCAGSDYTYVTTTTGYKLTFCIGSNNGDYPKGIVICKNGNCLVQDDCGEVVTDRDGYTYNTALIGDQCWMTNNLRTRTRPNGSILSWFERTCVTGDGTSLPGNGAICPPEIGAIYTWDAAMDYGTIEGAQGLCPDGWHLPTNNEFVTLERAVCTSENCRTDFPFDNTSLTGTRGSTEGEKLRIDGSSGFEAGPDVGGISNVGIHNPGWTPRHWGQGIDFWSSTMVGEYIARWHGMYSFQTAVMWKNEDTANRVSVRCIKD